EIGGHTSQKYARLAVEARRESADGVQYPRLGGLDDLRSQRVECAACRVLGEPIVNGIGHRGAAMRSYRVVKSGSWSMDMQSSHSRSVRDESSTSPARALNLLRISSTDNGHAGLPLGPGHFRLNSESAVRTVTTAPFRRGNSACSSSLPATVTRRARSAMSSRLVHAGPKCS